MSTPLSHKTTGKVIVNSVTKARTILERMVGLLGKKEIPNDFTLWISPCKSIHTFFMKFPIDVLFVDKQLCIVSLFNSVPPGKIIFGGFKSHSVFEMKANLLKQNQLKKGDQLYVGY